VFIPGGPRAAAPAGRRARRGTRDGAGKKIRKKALSFRRTHVFANITLPFITSSAAPAALWSVEVSYIVCATVHSEL